MLLQADTKPLYHAAAVMASNYAVTLMGQSAELLAHCGLDGPDAVRALLPLLAGTMENLAALGLPQALTGPLSRGDAGTIARHLAHLDAVAPDVAGLSAAWAGPPCPSRWRKARPPPSASALRARCWRLRSDEWSMVSTTSKYRQGARATEGRLSAVQWLCPPTRLFAALRVTQESRRTPTDH